MLLVILLFALHTKHKTVDGAATKNHEKVKHEKRIKTKISKLHAPAWEWIGFGPGSLSPPAHFKSFRAKRLALPPLGTHISCFESPPCGLPIKYLLFEANEKGGLTSSFPSPAVRVNLLSGLYKNACLRRELQVQWAFVLYLRAQTRRLDTFFLEKLFHLKWRSPIDDGTYGRNSNRWRPSSTYLLQSDQ